MSRLALSLAVGRGVRLGRPLSSLSSLAPWLESCNPDLRAGEDFGVREVEFL